MSYSAKSLFSDWYIQGVKYEVNEQELVARKKAAATVVGLKKPEIWYDIVKIFYGLLPEQSATYQLIVSEFKKEDDDFPLLKNHHVVRLLAGCILAQKIETEDAALLSQRLCLALLTSAYGKLSAELPLPELPSRAQAIWVNQCVRVRQPAPNLAYHYSLSKAAVGAKLELPAEKSVSGTVLAETFNTAIGKIQAQVNNLATDSKAARQSSQLLPDILTDIDSRLRTISEETNALWWLYSTFSRDFDKSFREIGLLPMCVCAPKELADLTLLLPGFPNYKSLLYKALLESGLPAQTETVAFTAIIESLESLDEQGTWMANLAGNVPENLAAFLPCLYALKCFQDYKAGKTWQTVFKKQNVFDLSAKVAPLTFAQQLYQELLLTRIAVAV